MMTGERIVRRRMSGREVVYHYYRCANNNPPSDHPVVRWSAEKLDEAVVAELESMRIHDEAHAQLIRNTLTAAFADVAKLEADRRRALTRLRSETKGRLDRLMNIFLDGAIEHGEFSVKQGQLRAELADVDRQLEENPRIDAKRGELALAVFDFMQNAADLWKRSKPPLRREILAAVSLNRRVSDVSLVLEKRKPFDIADEGLISHFGRGEWIDTHLSSPVIVLPMLALHATVIPWSVVRRLVPRRRPRPHRNWRRDLIKKAGGICARELAELADISETTIYRWREEGLVPPFPTRDGVAMWSQDEVAEWLGIIEAVVVQRLGTPGPGRMLRRLVG
jgi:predicted DNA-binding transcriptional regulator AlpA